MDYRKSRLRISRLPNGHTGELEDRIVRLLGKHQVAIICSDFWNCAERLEKDLGIFFGARGSLLIDVFLKLAKEGRIIAYHSEEGKTSRDIEDLEFCSRSLWEREVSKMPELELQRERFADEINYVMRPVPVYITGNLPESQQV